MKIKIISTLVFGLSASWASASLIITGVFDGPLFGGTPKLVEIYASTAIADISTYSVEYWFNASSSSSFTTALSGSVAAGDFIYLSPNGAEFTTYFGGTVDFGGGSINGDDSVVLTNSGIAIDTFGSPGTDGTGEPWEYLDGWAYRNNNTGPDGSTMNLSNWTFSGTDVNDDETSNATATMPFPIGTFSIIPEPSSVLLGSFGLLALLRRRR